MTTKLFVVRTVWYSDTDLLGVFDDRALADGAAAAWGGDTIVSELTLNTWYPKGFDSEAARAAPASRPCPRPPRKRKLLLTGGDR